MIRCSAKAKGHGGQCKKAPMRGSNVCAAHGGRAPQTRRKALQREAESAAVAQLVRLDIQPISDPLYELAKLGGRAKAWSDFFESRVLELSSLRYEGPAGEQIRAEIVLLERSLDRLAHILVAIGRLNIDERMAKIDEARAERVFRSMDRGCDEAGINPTAKREILKATARHLRLLEESA